MMFHHNFVTRQRSFIHEWDGKEQWDETAALAIVDYCRGILTLEDSVEELYSRIKADLAEAHTANSEVVDEDPTG